MLFGQITFFFFWVLNNNLITLTASIFKSISGEGNINICFISVPFIAALIWYQDSQMNRAFKMGVLVMSTEGRKTDFKKKKVLFMPRLVSFEDCLWTSLDGRRKMCYKSVVLNTGEDVWINVYTTVRALTLNIIVHVLSLFIKHPSLQNNSSVKCHLSRNFKVTYFYSSISRLSSTSIMDFFFYLE